MTRDKTVNSTDHSSENKWKKCANQVNKMQHHACTKITVKIHKIMVASWKNHGKMTEFKIHSYLLPLKSLLGSTANVHQ